ncbi:MAG: hypothetical protein AAB604_01155, partial [Patescibacteria group bacterium]
PMIPSFQFSKVAIGRDSIAPRSHQAQDAVNRGQHHDLFYSSYSNKDNNCQNIPTATELSDAMACGRMQTRFDRIANTANRDPHQAVLPKILRRIRMENTADGNIGSGSAQSSFRHE